MGKTGTTIWAQIKGVKGKIRLVPKKEGLAKTPGPNQRFKAGANVKQIDAAAEALQGRGGKRGGSKGGRRGGSRGDRSGGSGLNESTANPMIRRRMARPKVSALGTKAKSSR